MLCKAETKPAEQGALFRIAFRGISAMGDLALWERPLYGDQATAILLSLYGSENQLRGIFSALAINHTVDLNGEKLTRGWQGNLKFKGWKTGYGKCHALIWNEKLVPECVIAFETETKTEAWERFLRKRRIPFLKEWIPQIAEVMEKTVRIEKLSGINLRGWHFTASDDEVCDQIVEEIYR